MAHILVLCAPVPLVAQIENGCISAVIMEIFIRMAAWVSLTCRIHLCSQNLYNQSTFVVFQYQINN